MKKLIALIAVVGLTASIAVPATQDTAERTYPKPLIAQSF